MLQQTQAATVIPYFERFVARFPTLQSLALAEEAEVLRLWEGLGYYRRARQLLLAAKAMDQQGINGFPRTLEEAIALPGIGRYTAGAVLSIAYDQRTPILEANTIRLLSRLSAFSDDTSDARGQRFLWELSESLLPRRRCGAYNQALMELGALVCTPTSPDCPACPLRSCCAAYEMGLQSSIPKPKAKKQYEERLEAAVIVETNNRLALRRCRADERWAGLWDVPRFQMPAESRSSSLSESKVVRQVAEKVQQQLGGPVQTPRHIATIRHGVTRFRITLACYRTRWLGPQPRDSLPNDAPLGQYTWAPFAELEQYPLSSTGRKLIRLMADGERTRKEDHEQTQIEA